MAAQRGVARWLLPSFSDCLFIAIIVWLFIAGPAGWAGLLADGDVGWHIRTGDHILRTGEVPHRDLFSWSKPDAAWFAWEWLAEVGLSAAHTAAGLKGVVLLAAGLLSLTFVLLMRHMVWRGANPIVAMGVGLLTVGAASVHFLARPHVVTMLLLVVGLWVVDRDRRSATRSVWLLAPMVALWANLHGGFPLFLVLLGLLSAGSLAEAWWQGSLERWRLPVRYGLLTGACASATLLNPYGLALHQHIAEYLQANWIRDLVQEFQAPTFRTENQLHYQALLFAGLMAAAGGLRRREVVRPAWVLFLAHWSLTSVRHAPLFAIVAAPLVANELTALWRAWAEPLRKAAVPRLLWEVGQDLTPGFRRFSVWSFAFMASLCAADQGLVRWPQDFPSLAFPTGMIQRHGEALATARVLTVDQWADYLIYHGYPRQRVFLDGRSDFFGRDLGMEYLRMSQGEWRWRESLRRHQFDAVLCPVAWPLASLLKGDGEWRVVEDDGQSILFWARGSALVPPPVPAAKLRQQPNGSR